MLLVVVVSRESFKVRGSSTALTVSVAVLVALEKAPLPPVLLTSTLVPTVLPSLPSQARKVRVGALPPLWRAALLGRTPLEQGLVESLQRKAEFEGMIAGSEVFRNQHPQFAGRSIPGGGGQLIPAIPALVARGRQTIERFYDWLETQLQRSPYLVGASMTMADVTAFCAIGFHAWIEIGIPAGNSATLAWYAALNDRPSAKA